MAKASVKKTPTKTAKDKRFFGSVKAKSKTTGKAPTKRLVKRRTETMKAPAGYYANPIKQHHFIVKANDAGKVTGYFTGTSFSTSKLKGVIFRTKLQAATVAKGLKTSFNLGVLSESNKKKC